MKYASVKAVAAGLTILTDIVNAGAASALTGAASPPHTTRSGDRVPNKTPPLAPPPPPPPPPTTFVTLDEPPVAELLLLLLLLLG